MNLYICSTFYHVYITLLKKYNSFPVDSVVICDDIPEGEQLTLSLEKSGLFRDVWYVEQSKLPEERGNNALDWIFFQHKRRAKAIRPLLPFKIQDFQEIYIFHDATFLGMYLMDEMRSYHLIEDSLNFYQNLWLPQNMRFLVEKNWKKNLKFWLRSGYFPMGESSCVIDVEVNKNKDLQVNPKKTIVELPRKDLEQKLTAENKTCLLQLFQSLMSGVITENIGLLLTQPLYQDGLCGTKEEQGHLYDEMVCFLKEKGCEIWLKPHPRDDFDYVKMNVTIIPKNFPIELLQFVSEEPFAYVVSVSSTSTVRAREYIFWNERKNERN